MLDVPAGELHANYVPDAARARAKEKGDSVALKERLSLLWVFVLLNYLYADVMALWARVPLGSIASRGSDAE